MYRPNKTLNSDSQRLQSQLEVLGGGPHHVLAVTKVYAIV